MNLSFAEILELKMEFIEIQEMGINKPMTDELLQLIRHRFAKLFSEHNLDIMVLVNYKKNTIVIDAARPIDQLALMGILSFS